MGRVEIRPGFRRPAPQHSLAGALTVGSLLAAISVAVFILAGGMQ